MIFLCCKGILTNKKLKQGVLDRQLASSELYDKASTMMKLSFENQVAVISGGASGLGLAIARKLISNNVRVLLLDIDSSGLEEITGELGEKANSRVLDISNEESVQRIISEIIEEYGSIDILVNSAGITGNTGIMSHEVDSVDMERVFNVNFKGSWMLSKYIIPYMLKQDYGRILHIASIAGKEGNAGMLAYSASKAAVIGMAKVQGKEYAGSGITVNALAPAVIRTKMVENMPEEQVKYMTDKIPMKRCGTLEEIANLAKYIVSPENSFTTGFTFDLSGGRATY